MSNSEYATVFKNNTIYCEEYPIYITKIIHLNNNKK
jgi:hypothetical protein